jgi:beta-N-acetylhexosaminidase
VSGSHRLRRGLAALLLTAALAGCRTLPEPGRLTALVPELGQLLLVGFGGTEPAPGGDVERLLCQARVGGVVLFARNVVDAAQLARLTAWMHERARACTGHPLLVAMDAEGGRVMRLGPAAGYTSTLSAEELGRANDLALTELEALRIGGRLRAAGVNWNLAPVVDVGYNPANPVIVGPGRSYGASPALVAAHARAFIRGTRAAGLLTALKHFPGHGSSVADSHLGFVDVTDTADRDLELAPYRALLAEDLVDSVMTAHVVNRWLDARHPATLSRATIQGLLRERLRYAGAVVSDDLRMGAIDQHYGLGEAAVLALRAGVDVLLIADDRLPDGRSATAVALGAVRRAVADGRLSVERVTSALARVGQLKARLPAAVSPSPSRRSDAGPVP